MVRVSQQLSEEMRFHGYRGSSVQSPSATCAGFVSCLGFSHAENDIRAVSRGIQGVLWKRSPKKAPVSKKE